MSRTNEPPSAALLLDDSGHLSAALLLDDSGHLSDVGITAAIDGELREGAASAHLDACEACGQRLGRAALGALRVGDMLRTQLDSADAPVLASAPAASAPTWVFALALVLAAIGAVTQLGKSIRWAVDAWSLVAGAAPQLARHVGSAATSGVMPGLATVVLVMAGLAIARGAARQTVVEGAIES